ncbi:MAG TPA: PadR family transcriptional regulator [Vicinamibacterales bacterium]|jgi:PadR family transcriptional regulator PadR|nr:PadR family transcriptional regulator [Vicinamibacterales bacterium]
MADLLQGTLDLLILRTLTLEPQHGWGIARRIHQLTQGTFDVKPGSMFPALKRLEEQGWIASEWGESENKRQAKFYRLTKPGRRHIETEVSNWKRVSTAIDRAIEATS